MKIEVHITNAKALDFFSRAPDKIDKAVEDGIKAISNEAFGRIVGNKGLRKRQHPPGQRTNAPVGEPPAYVTGNLVNSVQIQPIRRKGFASYSQETTAGAHYARRHEFGMTEEGKEFPKRPFVAPVRTKMLEDGTAQRILKRHLNEAWKVK